MRIETHRGLAGKARENHQRNRATRHFQGELITEYFEFQKDEPTRGRYIPIRRRSEFFPSAMAAGRFTNESFSMQRIFLTLKLV